MKQVLVSVERDVAPKNRLHFDPGTTLAEFVAMGEKLSKEAGVLDGLHSYFREQAPRLYKACQLFNLGSASLGDVLEIGAFYGYTPFMLQGRSSSYRVLEGDDPGAYLLQPLYQRRGIALSYVDLFESFGPIESATNRLPASDECFDTILCWETMEHFNFNPVKFVREMHRILKPGGRAFITVPNKASFQSLVSLLFGRGEREFIEGYYRFENYELKGKKGFFGFHWREYSPAELSHLFGKAGFKIESCGSFTAFQHHGRLSLTRRLFRLFSSGGTAVLPRHGTHAYLIAVR